MAYVRFKNGIEVLPPNSGVRNNIVGENYSATTADTIFSSVLIPANTFSSIYVGEPSFFDIHTLYTNLTYGGTIRLTLRIGSGNTTSDNVVGVLLTSNAKWIPFSRRFFNSTVAGNNTIGSGTGITNNTYIISNSIQQFNVDWSRNNYITVSLSASTTTPVGNVEYIKLIDGTVKVPYE